MAQGIDIEQADRDERLGEAVETYLELLESGTPPDPEDFVADYPDLGDDLREALAGLSLVQGLVGSTGGGGRGRRLEVGRRLAGYRIAGELGAGGMGVVYEAVHVDLDRPVALKVLDARFTRDGSTGLRRFLNEARTAAALHHTNIVPVFDVGHVGGLCYYAMQRIEGSGLDRVIKALRHDRSTGAGSGSGRRTPMPGSLPAGASGGNDLSGLVDPAATASWRVTAGEVPGTAPVGAEVAEPPYEPPRGSGYYRWVAEVGRVSAQALAFAHGRGVIHRDVKPSNILIDGQGTIWVADFGLARRLADPARPADRSNPALVVAAIAGGFERADGGLTRTDGLVGTPRYMSPEQSRSQPIDPRTDIYSLGATLYELLALRPPFEGRSTSELIEQINSGEPKRLRRIDPRIPRDLEAIVHKALARRADERYQDAAAMSADLARFLAFEPVQARPIGPPGRALRLARRHPAASLVASVATVLIVAIAGYAYLRVLDERNVAVRAWGEAREAEKAMLAERDRAIEAERTTRATLREQKLSQAQVLRASSIPNRREQGLTLLREAAGMRPDADLRARLQAEAVAFLALRDVRREPDLPTGEALGLAFGPGGDQLAVATREGGLYSVWSLESRAPLNTDNTRAAGGRDGRRDPSGSRIATAGDLGAVLLSDGRGFRLFQASTGEAIRDVPTPSHRNFALQAVETRSGPRLVTIGVAASEADFDGPFDRRGDGPPRGRGDGPPQGQPGSGPPPPPRRGDGPTENDRRLTLQVYLWDPQRPEAPLATLTATPPEDVLFTFPMVTASLDGTRIATSWTWSSVVSLWSAEDGSAQGEIDARTGVTALALGPSGVLAAAGSGGVRLWEVATQTQLPIVSTQLGYVWQLRFSPDGTMLAVAGNGADVELWDPAGGSLVAALPTPDRVNELAFAPDGSQLAARMPESTALWAIVDSEVRARMAQADAPPTSLAFGPDGWLAVAFRNPTEIDARLWRPSWSPSAVLPLEGIAASGVAFDDGGHVVALEEDELLWFEPRTSCGERGHKPEPERRLALPTPFEPRGGPPPAPRNPQMTRLSQALWSSPDGRRLVVYRGGPPQVLLWEADDPDRIREVVPPPRDPDERFPDRGRPPGRGLGFASLAIAPASDPLDRLYLVQGRPGRLVTWSLDREARGQLIGPTVDFEVSTLAVCPNGSSLALALRDQGVVVVDAGTGTVRFELSEAGPVSALAFSPDGDTLAIGGRDGNVALWDLHEATRSRPSSSLRLPGHRGAVLALVFSPDGTRIASAAEDKAVEVWRLDRLRPDLAELGLAW